MLELRWGLDLAQSNLEVTLPGFQVPRSLLVLMSCSLALEEISPKWQEGRDGQA